MPLSALGLSVGPFVYYYPLVQQDMKLSWFSFLGEWVRFSHIAMFIAEASRPWGQKRTVSGYHDFHSDADWSGTVFAVRNQVV